MTVTCKQLLDYLQKLLQPQLFQDYCPNGLQVEGAPVVRKLIAGVSASQALVDYAASVNAQAVLVHHGYFWRNEEAVVVGMKKKRLQTLLQHDINLLVYHLLALVLFSLILTISKVVSFISLCHYSISSISSIVKSPAEFDQSLLK